MYGFADMHCDTMGCIWEEWKKGNEVRLRRREGHIDVERLVEAGYMMQTFAMFVFLRGVEDPTAACLEMIDLFWREMEANADRMAVVTSADQVLENWKKGKLSALLSIEEGAVCKGNLAILRNFYRLGVRMMTLTWNFENELAWPNVTRGSDPKEPNTKYGLKEKGFEFLAEMERLGMLIDVSHLSDAGFYDVYAHTTKPFIASHSNAREVCGHVRNLTDDMIRKLAERGGVTGLNFCADFVEKAEGKEPFGTLDGLIRQAKYIVNVGGIDCLGLGTDYDGIGDDIELLGCQHMPRLAEGLKKAGFHESEIDKICHDNVLRVMRDVL